MRIYTILKVIYKSLLKEKNEIMCFCSKIEHI